LLFLLTLFSLPFSCC